MNWLEVIKLRSAGKGSVLLDELVIVGMQFTQPSTICSVWPPIIILRGTG